VVKININSELREKIMIKKKLADKQKIKEINENF
jgi:hypothetical protein